MVANKQSYCTHAKPSNRLILCFDGTGNEFKGASGDTNIVKLYNMFDRTNLSQMHYYQPGIGTYPAEGPVNVSWFRTLVRKFEKVIDSAVATSFDSHVIAGYRFLMRHYKPGDRIYVFGFSRGAFTARFLSRMISHVGLLSVGNDELVPFAYKVYQEYEQNRNEKKQNEQPNFMNSFKNHFCRTEPKKPGDSDNESGIKVHFLGLFDCVSSVGNLDVPFFQKAPPLPAVQGTAEHIRHAVAIDERRVKFKAALFSQEPPRKGEDGKDIEDIKEVWFPGNHGDVGGGWDVTAVGETKHNKGQDNNDRDHFQLSDIALKWMIDEIDNVEGQTSSEDHANRLAWDVKEKASFIKRFQQARNEMVKARMHDTMTFEGSDSWSKVPLWRFMEWIPWVIKRWEYMDTRQNPGVYSWKYIGWPANLGGCRDIPSTALFHHSVISRMRLPTDGSHRPSLYLPKNSLFVRVDGNQLNLNTKTIKVGRDGKGQYQVIETNISELAKQHTPKETANGHSETQQLIEPQIRFVHEKNLDKGSSYDYIDREEKKKTVVIGPEKSDRIYRVEFGAK